MADRYSVQQMLLVVSHALTSVNTTDIGGLQSGWNVAVTSSENSALPFWTGKSPAAETDSLLAAFGWLLPGFMHAAVAVTTICTWASSPSPASLPSTVRVLPLVVAVQAVKCGLPAQLADVTSTSVARIAIRHYRG